MSFDDLARKFCEDNKDDERCACFVSDFPSELEARKGSEYKDDIKACYNPVCIGSNYVPSNLKSVHDVLKTCTNIYDVTNKIIKNAYGGCSSAETNNYLLPVVNWSYDCKTEKEKCDGVCNPNTKDDEVKKAKENCGLSTGEIVGIVIGSVVGAIIIGFIIRYLYRRWKIKQLGSSDNYPIVPEPEEKNEVVNTPRPNPYIEDPDDDTD